MNRKKSILISLTGITVVMLALLGLTYGYYITNIIGNTNSNSISIDTKDLKLEYNDGTEDLVFGAIEPGWSNEDSPKVFTVNNIGKDAIDEYAVGIDEVINELNRTEDLTYTITCKSYLSSAYDANGEDAEEAGVCRGDSGEFPKENSLILTNQIDSGYIHVYEMIISYEYLDDVNQSEDMGASIGGRIQIYTLPDTIDITGTVASYSEGDYVEISTPTKTSQIVDGKYKLIGVEPGNHTLSIKYVDENDVVQTRSSKEIVIKKGNEAKVDGNTITMTNESRISIVDIDVSTQSINVSTTLKSFDKYDGVLGLNFATSQNINLTTNKIVEDVDIKTQALTIPFTVSNESNKHQNITIKLTDIEMDDALKNIDFRWGLYNANTEVGLSFGIFKYTEDEELIYTDTIIDAGAEPNNYKLRIWVHNNGTAQTALLNKSFKAKISVSSEDIKYTPESCFAFDASTGSIRSTFLYDPISAIDESCGTDIVFPKTINGVEVKKLEGPFFTNTDENNGLNALTSMIIPNTVEIIAGCDFCMDLKAVTIPEGVEIIARDTFGGATGTSIERFYIPETVNTIDDYAITLSSSSILIIPSTIRSLTEVRSSKELILMNGIESIGNAQNWNIFYSGTGNIEIPSSVTFIGPGAFWDYGGSEIVVRGGRSLEDFGEENGLTEYGMLPSGVNVVFRP